MRSQNSTAAATTKASKTTGFHDARQYDSKRAVEKSRLVPIMHGRQFAGAGWSSFSSTATRTTGKGVGVSVLIVAQLHHQDWCVSAALHWKTRFPVQTS